MKVQVYYTKKKKMSNIYSNYTFNFKSNKIQNDINKLSLGLKLQQQKSHNEKSLHAVTNASWGKQNKKYRI